MIGMVDRVIAEITVLWGWRRLVVAIAAGAVSAAALAPVFAFAVLFVTLPVLIWLIDGTAAPERRARRLAFRPAWSAFAIGWAFGLGYFVAGLYWVGFALLVDSERHAWALPLAVVALPAGLAIFTGLAAMAARVLWVAGYGRVVALAASWTAMEWLRGEVLTGFPWNLVGHAFAGSQGLMQAAAYGGDLALSLLVMLTAAAPACLADGARGGFRRFAPTLAAIAVLAAVWAGGMYRLAQAEPGTVPGVVLRIVQPNIPQSLKWAPDHRSESVSLYFEMSDIATSPQSMGVSSVTHLIWPETALPLLMEATPAVLAQIAALLPADAHLIAGGLRAEPPTGGPDARFFNSVFVIGSDATVENVYDKHRLVPFGEFLPFQSQMEALGLTQITGLIGGFAQGAGPATMNAGTAPRFSPLICYEIVFSGQLFGRDRRPGWIVNVTNDAWFGASSGPAQHFAQARLRAVEEGIAVVRAANTGISAVIDSHGRVLHRLGYGRRGVIDSDLPAPIEPTAYATFGRLPVAIFLTIAFLGLGFLRFRTDIGATPSARTDRGVLPG